MTRRAASALNEVCALLVLVGTLGACRVEHILGVVNGEQNGDGGLGANQSAPCGLAVSSSDFLPCVATYLCGKGAEPGAAIDVGRDGQVVVAATLDGVDLGPVKDTRELIRGAGAGALVRLAHDGRSVSSVWRLGDSLLDMDVDPNRGTIVVVGSPFGVAAVRPDGEVLWDAPIFGGRVAVGSDGTVAVLDEKSATVTVLDWTGLVQRKITIGDGAAATDVAVHGGSATVIVTGSVPAGTIRQPLLSGYGYDGKLKWKDYAWSETAVGSHHASTSGVRVAIGRDDRLYYAGESHGGNTTHSYNPRAIAENAPLRSFDGAYTTAYDVGPAMVLFIGRFRPADGVLEVGLMHLTRLAGAKPTAQGMNPLAIAADERGNVIVGGTQRCCMSEQDKKTVRGTKLGRADPDAFVLQIRSDFSGRTLWTTWSQGSPASTVGVAMARGVAAASLLQDQASAAKAPLITVDAFQVTPAGGASDGFVSVWSAP